MEIKANSQDLSRTVTSLIDVFFGTHLEAIHLLILPGTRKQEFAVLPRVCYNALLWRSSKNQKSW